MARDVSPFSRRRPSFPKAKKVRRDPGDSQACPSGPRRLEDQFLSCELCPPSTPNSEKELMQAYLEPTTDQLPRFSGPEPTSGVREMG